MIISIYLRPLTIEDAKISYVWRNDPQIWRYTMFKANHYISVEVETAWLQGVLNKPDNAIFAICVKELDTYIGNVRLINIHDKGAEFHLFIGNKLYWGKGAGYQATVLALKFAFFELGLEKIWLHVHPANIPALSIYEKVGFEITGNENGYIRMDLSKSQFVATDKAFE